MVQGYDMNVTLDDEAALDLKLDELRAKRVAVLKWNVS
jgi:hypothetical protein